MTASTLAPLPARGMGNKELVDDLLWQQLVTRVEQDSQLDRELAERIMSQALGFLRLVAENPGQSFSPSPLVDIGWHTFVLHTRAYMAFCCRLAGAFIHHEPTAEAEDREAVIRTVSAMRASGIPVDDELWDGSAQCGSHCRAAG
jgi:hypothetical protein